MKFKTNLVVGAIFLGLLAFVYFYEIKGGEERQQAAQKAKELLNFKQSEARRLVIDRGDTVVVLEKKDGAWTLTAPVVDAVDEQAVERYLRNLQETEREKVIVDSADVVADPQVAAQYGLGVPRLKVLLETETGAMDSLLFGKDTPTDRYTYVQQRGINPEVFAVRAWRFDNLDKGAFDLRDRRVLPFDEDKVEELRLLRPDEEIVVGKAGDGWQLEKPVVSPADREGIEGILNQLKNARVEGFVVEEADAQTMEEHGLAPLNRLEVSLLVGEERAEKRLRVGDETENGKFYARDMSSPQIFLVDSTLVNQLGKEPADLRNRKPVAFDRESVRRLELDKEGARFTAEKDTADSWAIVEPEPQAAKSWKLNSLLTDLAAIEVEAFAAEETGDLSRYGLVEPRLTIRLMGEGEELLDARFGEDGQGKVYLMLGGEAPIYQVAAESIADLGLRLDDVAQSPPAKSEGAGSVGADGP